MDLAAYFVKLTVYTQGQNLSIPLLQLIRRFAVIAKPPPPFVNGEQVLRDQFRANDLHSETLNSSIMLSAACVCYPLTFLTESTVLKNMLFPVPMSVVFLALFLLVSVLQDAILDRAIRRVSRIDALFPYTDGPGFRNRLFDSYASLVAIFILFKSGFLFQELKVGNFAPVAASR